MFHRKLFFPESFPGHVRPIKKVKVPLSLGGGGAKGLSGSAIKKIPFCFICGFSKESKEHKTKG